jgi:DNA mismatch repair protein MutS
LAAQLDAALVEAPPVLIRDGGVIAEGYDAAPRRAARARRERRAVPAGPGDTRARAHRAAIRSRSATTACTATTSRSARPQARSAPADYQRRQTLKGAERFITPELKDFEDRALSARERALARARSSSTMGLIEDGSTASCLAGLQATFAAVAELDVLASLADACGDARLPRPSAHRRALLRRCAPVVTRW